MIKLIGIQIIDVTALGMHNLVLNIQESAEMIGTVEEALTIERKKTAFSTEKMKEFIYGAEYIKHFYEVANKGYKFPYDFNLFNEGRVEILKETYSQIPLLRQTGFLDDPNEYIVANLLLTTLHQAPGSIHVGMYMRCIEFMGTDYQQEQYMQRCRNLEMIGCYAQTELGHGSDVQNLETTATFVEATDQFILDSPTTSAAKYWPGDMGITANFALVFAQLIVKGKNHGVQSFICRIRDDDHKPMPGVEVGDIGPKIGFHAKDNGFLLLHNVRIPKKDMLRRYTSVSKKGDIKKKGNPKISYATMMSIRTFISCSYPRIYEQAITIAARYSMFRRQFTNKSGEEIPVIEYQLQQEKIIPRVAECYAIAISGNRIRKLCSENFIRVLKKEDFTLMAETHACLSFSKSFFSETVFNGMEICRRACGGHGFSHYSGLPSIYFEYAPNVTHEGENTILYLQTARYLMKSYKNSLTKRKPLGASVQYLDSYDFLMGKKCEVEGNDIERWSLEDLRILLSQAVCHLLSVVGGKIMSKEEGQSDIEALNYDIGIRLQQLAIAHACYYIYDSFREAVTLEKDQRLKEVLRNLCAMYGTNVIIANAGHIIEGEFIRPDQLSCLKNLRENLLRKLRPNLIGLIDSFALPEKMIRSELTYGDPYQNFYELAKKGSLNNSIQEAAIIINNGIQEVLKAKL